MKNNFFFYQMLDRHPDQRILKLQNTTIHVYLRLLSRLDQLERFVQLAGATAFHVI